MVSWMSRYLVQIESCVPQADSLDAHGVIGWDINDIPRKTKGPQRYRPVHLLAWMSS